MACDIWVSADLYSLSLNEFLIILLLCSGLINTPLLHVAEAIPSGFVSLKMPTEYRKYDPASRSSEYIQATCIKSQ